MKTHRKVCFSNENAVMCSGEGKQKVWAKDFPRFGSLVETKTNSFYLLHPYISFGTDKENLFNNQSILRW